MRRLLPRSSTLLTAALLAFAVGCGSPFSDAQEADTIAAYEQFLGANPSSPYRLQAETRLEQLYLDKARADQSLPSYDTYLEKFPTGTMREKALAERRDFLYAWADEQNTVAGWEQFLKEYATGGDKKQRKVARKRLRMAEHRDKVELAPVEMEQVNLAENPDGPLDGWGFFVDVTNKGDQAIGHLYLKVSYLDAAGKALDSDSWPVATKVNPGGIPIEETYKQPLKPGETRTWTYTSGDMPAGWSKKVSVVPVDIGFVGEGEADAE